MEKEKRKGDCFNEKRRKKPLLGFLKKESFEQRGEEVVAFLGWPRGRE